MVITDKELKIRRKEPNRQKCGDQAEVGGTNYIMCILELGAIGNISVDVFSVSATHFFPLQH